MPLYLTKLVLNQTLEVDLLNSSVLWPKPPFWFFRIKFFGSDTNTETGFGRTLLNSNTCFCSGLHGISIQKCVLPRNGRNIKKLRKRKYNFWRNGSVKNFRQMMTITGLYFDTFISRQIGKFHNLCHPSMHAVIGESID